MKCVRLREYIEQLNAQTHSSLRDPTFQHYLTSHSVDFEDIVGFSRFRHDTFARNLISRTPLYELLLLAWLPGQAAPPQDCGGQVSWVGVASGRLSLQTYQRKLGRLGELLALGGATCNEPGQVQRIDGSELIHEFRNTSSIPALSLHLNIGPTDTCLEYDSVTRNFISAELWSFPPPPETQWIEAHPEPLE